MARERDGEQFLTVAEVAGRLRVYPSTVRRLIKAGRLPAIRVGRSIRVRERDFDAYTEPNRQWPPTPEETARRQRIIAEMRRRRAKMNPINTTELVRESRRALEARTERLLGGEGAL